MPIQSTYAKEDEHEIVRVGWYYKDLFQEGMSDTDKKSGYAYDYLQKVADYTSWDYDYVYGDWSDLLEKLENGEIDFLCGVAKTDQCSENVSFPDLKMDDEQYVIYKNSSDKSISSSDVNTFNGKKLGLIQDNSMSEYAEKWIEENNVNIEKVYYDDLYAQKEALENGDIDLIVHTTDLSKDDKDLSSVASLGERPYYLAVNKDREDLLNELNDALNTMTSLDPYILQTLQSNNYGTSLTAQSLTQDELLWLDEHSTITVGYLDDYLPYCFTDKKGNTSGILVDVLNQSFKQLDLETNPKIQYKAYKKYDDLVKDLKRGKIDIAFPVLNDLDQLEKDDIHASSEVVKDSGTLFYRKGSKKSSIKRISVNKNNTLQKNYTELTYPDCEIVYCSNSDECLKAVLKGSADGTIMDNLRIQYVTGNSSYDNLSYLQLSSDCGKCFGVKQGDKGILLLLNRSLQLIGSSYGLDCAYQYLDAFNQYTTLDFIRNHIVGVSVPFALFISLIIILLIQNIKRKELQVKEEERLKKEAESANAAKSTFLFNMSHDIRTPMNAVLGYAALMEKELNDPEKLKDYIHKIQISGDYLLNLINNVLEVARIDSGRETLDEEFVDLMDEQYSIILENEMQKKNQTFIKDLDVIHRYVLSDAQKIREIMLNLLSNAVKYTQEGGTITMSLREMDSEKEGYAKYIACVADTGIGMTDDFQKHIFEDFTRERNTTESKIAGTGLGMSIVKKMVDLFDGSVSVESKLGKGSKFTVVVDFKIVNNPEFYLEKRQKEKSKKVIDLSGKRILLAEDNELNAEIAKIILEENGLLVDVVGDGVECVNALHHSKEDYYDLILMDIQMPNLNGYGATRKIRKFEDHKKASIPIIAMTANAFEEDKKEAIEAGMNNHLAKPLDIQKLTEVLEQYLN